MSGSTNQRESLKVGGLKSAGSNMAKKEDKSEGKDQKSSNGCC